MLYKVVLIFESVDEILKCTTQMKATVQYLAVVLFIILYKVVSQYSDSQSKCRKTKAKD